MEWYRTIRTRPWQVSARYLFSFLVLLAFAIALVILPAVTRIPGAVRERISGSFPEHAEFTLKEGKLSANFGMPVDIGVEGFPVVIDTSAEVADGDEVPEGGFLIGRESVFYRQDSEIVEAFDLSGFPDGTLDRAQAGDLLDRYGALIVAVALTSFVFAHLIFLALNTAVFILFTALLAMYIGRLWRVRLYYDQWISVGFHAVTLPVIIDHFFWAFSSRIPFAFSFIYFMFVMSVIADERTRPTHQFRRDKTNGSK